jgi:hypothetical protein
VPQIEYQNDSDEACRAELQATKEARFRMGDMAKNCYRGIPVTWEELTLSACPISEFNGVWVVMIVWAAFMVSTSRNGGPGGFRTQMGSSPSREGDSTILMEFYDPITRFRIQQISEI